MVLMYFAVSSINATDDNQTLHTILCRDTDFGLFDVNEHMFEQYWTLSPKNASARKQVQISDGWLDAAMQKIDQLEMHKQMMRRNACRLRMLLQAFALAEEKEFVQIELDPASDDDNICGWRHVHITHPIAFCKLIFHYIFSNITTWNFYAHIQRGGEGQPIAYRPRRKETMNETRFFIAMEIPQLLLMMRITMLRHEFPSFVQAAWSQQLTDCENFCYERCSYDKTYQNYSWFREWMAYERDLTETREMIFQQWYATVRLTLCQGLHGVLGANSVLRFTSADIIIQICKQLEDGSPW